jgi:probable HAF family extracellular repeat protein
MRTLIAVFFSTALSLSAATFNIKDLGLLPGFELSRGTDLNDRSQVVGYLETSNNVSRAFVWEDGAMKLLGMKLWTEGLASSINNHGEIVGAMRVDGARHSFLFREDTYSDLGEIDRFPRLGMPGSFVAGGSINDNSRMVVRLTVPNGDQRTALWSEGEPAFFGVLDDGRLCSGAAINNHDHIVGQVFDSNSHSRPFLWRDGEFTDLGSLGGTRASATEINDQGMVVGWALPTDTTLREAHAFVWDERHGLRDLGTLGGRTSRAYGLNNRGQVVGYSHTSENSYVAFLWEKGQLRNLNELVADSAWNLISAGAINDRGQILASGFSGKGGKRRAVLLSPNEPLQFAKVARRPLSPAVGGRSEGGKTFNLNSFDRLADGSFRLGFAGVAGREYAVEVSTTLKTWTRLGVASNVNGQITFTDHSAARSKLCFYRAIQLQAREVATSK